MPARTLDLEVLHRRRRADHGQFQAAGDPADAGWLRGQLRGWLEAERWDRSRWGEFELVARPAGRGGPRVTVRA